MGKLVAVEAANVITNGLEIANKHTYIMISILMGWRRVSFGQVPDNDPQGTGSAKLKYSAGH